MATVTTTTKPGAPMPWRGLSRLSQEQVVAVIVVLLLLVFALALPGFATLSNLLGLVRSISILGILGLGMGLIVISRGIDLSEDHGRLLVRGSYRQPARLARGLDSGSRA